MSNRSVEAAHLTSSLLGKKTKYRRIEVTTDIQESNNSSRRWPVAIALMVFSVIVVALGTFSGKRKFLAPSISWSESELPSNYAFYSSENARFTRQYDDDRSDQIRRSLFQIIDPSRIVDTLHKLTKDLHVAGTPENKRVAETLAAIWRLNGLQDVHFISYDVLLSYPDYDNPNHIVIYDKATGQIVFKSTGLSPDLNPKNEFIKNNHAAVQWLAFSLNGTVSGDPVYCHYGRVEDFEHLKNLRISVKNRIAILRYGSIFRGDMVLHAQQAGAIGAIIFSDPAEVAKEGILNDETYPNAYWLPSGGVQRGSIMRMDGDPLTPLLPSKPNLMRGLTIDQARERNVLPKIPVLPIGYNDAYELIGRLGGDKAPVEWQGGLNVTYKLGPGFSTSDDIHQNNDDGRLKLRLEVHNSLEIKTIQNIVGYIYGSEEPDSYVILGNHYDAWVYGSVDPNSGTAIMAEVGRAFGETVSKERWRPRRTLMFCAWDAEEPGIIGSTEFVQEFAEILRDRAVVYLNVDLISNNQTLKIHSIPLIYDSLVASAKKVRNPMQTEIDAGRTTIYDSWLYNFPSQSNWLTGVPQMDVPGGGSDHLQFLNFIGIPVADITYTNVTYWKSKNQTIIGNYPLYHSMYEVPLVNEHLFDANNLSVHVGMAKFWAELARSFADSEMLPMNATTFARKLLDNTNELKKTVDDLLNKHGVIVDLARKQVSALIVNIRRFIQDAITFERVIQKTQHTRFVKVSKRSSDVARLNSRLVKLNQCFVNPSLGPSKTDPHKRHVLYSLSSADSYSGSVMSAVFNAIRKFETRPSEANVQEIAYQITVIQYSVQCAYSTLHSHI